MSANRSSSYYDRQLRQSPALIRARRPYLVKNAIFGTALTAFTLGVYVYTLNAVGQDEFEDVKVPDVPITKAAGAAVQEQKK
ncbi:hypothetical protein B0H63DRAFT_461415 [Podospora didyma]|uniref:Cytochrome c oxidase assembly factor 3 n=1 Tax=Podospora didyma TaxID=330526 RepID=A0AAE0U879_9PEZI|nr:hypothetical protein B0H63DRAFT_461415 [Podospora didyma]